MCVHIASVPPVFVWMTLIEIFRTSRANNTHTVFFAEISKAGPHPSSHLLGPKEERGHTTKTRRYDGGERTLTLFFGVVGGTPWAPIAPTVLGGEQCLVGSIRVSAAQRPVV